MKVVAPRRWAVALAAVVGLGMLSPSAVAAPTPAESAPAPLAVRTVPTPLAVRTAPAPLVARTAAAPRDAVVTSMTVTGRLIDENGWPISGIGVYPYDTGTYFDVDPVVTGRDGSFTITATDSWSEVPAASYPARAELYERDFWEFIDVDPIVMTFIPGTTVDLGTITIRSSEHTGRAPGSVNSASKKAVRELYRQGFAKKVRQEKLVKVSGCSVAVTPKKLQKRELSALNTFRSLAGVAPVALSATLSKKATKAALIQYANGYPGHYPQDPLKCKTKTGVATSARSNLSFYRVGAINILDYMTDPGASNRVAGHRGWFLTPGLAKVGTGYAGRANAFYVVSPQDPANSRPLWVAWPTAGWFPSQLEPHGRWSLMTPRSDLDFSRAKVTMLVAGKKVKLSLTRGAGGGELTGLAWDLAQPIRVSGTKTVTATVTVSNIGLRGTSILPPVTYTVKLFNA